MTPRPSSPTSLLWAHELKRENGHLLGRIKQLETENLHLNATIVATNEKNSQLAARLEAIEKGKDQIFERLEKLESNSNTAQNEVSPPSTGTMDRFEDVERNTQIQSSQFPFSGTTIHVRLSPSEQRHGSHIADSSSPPPVPLRRSGGRSGARTKPIHNTSKNSALRRSTCLAPSPPPVPLRRSNRRPCAPTKPIHNTTKDSALRRSARLAQNNLARGERFD